MASLSAPSRRRPAPAPAPVAEPVPQVNDRPHEGWQPGGAAAKAPSPAPARPVVRHGTFTSSLGIGGKEYRIRPAQAGPPIEGVVTLRKLDGPAPVAYAVATDGLEIHCTCPDHEVNGNTCKHIMSIVRLARILAPFAAAADSALEGGAR